MAKALRKQVDPDQLDIDFSSPLDHHELLFEHQQNVVVLWHKDRVGLPKDDRPGPVWQTLNPNQTHSALLAVAGKFDTYITPNEFDGWRKVHLLRGLNAVYLDFDAHGKRLTQSEIRQWRDRVLLKIKELGWQEPTFSVHTGRGFHLYWVHHRMDARALDRWQALIRHMRKVLDADPMSVDCCRVLRVLGTRNSSAEQDFIVHGYSHSAQTYDFDKLYERICKPQKAVVREIESLRKARSLHKEERATKSDLPKDPTKFANIVGWFRRLHSDTWKLAAYHVALDEATARATGNLHHRGIQEGKRVSILEMFVGSMCWLRPVEELEDELLSFAHQFTPSLSDEEVLRDTQTLRKAAAVAAAGEKVAHEGKMVDPRYKYGREKAWERFGRLVPESLTHEMQALLPEDLYQERDKARRKTADAQRDRVVEGRHTSRNTGKGHRAINALKVALARQKAADGLPVAEIARELDTPYKTVYSWLTRPVHEVLQTARSLQGGAARPVGNCL